MDANDWKTCDPGNKKGWKASGDIKRCAEQQLFNLMSRCWYVYGQNNWNLATVGNEDYDCFGIEIKDLSTEVITEETLTNFMIEQKFDDGKSYCSEIANNCVSCVTPNAACGSVDQIYWDGRDMKTQQAWLVKFHDDVTWPKVKNDQINVKAA